MRQILEFLLCLIIILLGILFFSIPNILVPMH